jgi:periplasmic protein TonB
LNPAGDILSAHRRDSLPWGIGVTGAALLHALTAAVLIISSAGNHPYTVTNAVSVRLVPMGAIRYAPRPAPEPPPPQKERPKIRKIEEAPPPSKKAMILPDKSKKKPEPAPAPPSVSLPSPTSEAGGGPIPGVGPNLGTSVSSFDAADFNYSYYVQQMLTSIGTNWFRPTLESVPAPIIYFRIERDGTIKEARVEKSSGFEFVDRAALRAVLLSSPLPPLPAEYRGDFLGVHLKFQ